MHVEQGQAARVIGAVVDGHRRLDDALDSEFASAPDSRRGHALVREIAYGTLRHWGTLDVLVRLLARKPLADRVLHMLAAAAIYQILHLRAPAFAVVDRAVTAAARVARPAARPLMNALLRRFLREQAALVAAARTGEVGRYSYPQWWIDRVRRDYPVDWEPVLEAGNHQAPLVLRVNHRATRRVELLARFADAGIRAHGQDESAIVVEHFAAPETLPGFADGAFAVQDAGAQLAAAIVDARDGMRVLDGCAAPGGKTAHLIERAEIDLVALDADPARLERLRGNLARLGHAARSVRLVCADATTPDRWWDGRPFDRILLDVPCTGSGVVRRHPDIKWRRRPADVDAFAAAQARFLAAAWPLVAPGGRLVYATCSVFHAENDAVVEAFCAAQPEALRETLSFPPDFRRRGGQILPSPPAASHNQDGFYYASLRKT
ncbi:MAG: 16S rRNA (cytosine(967)-C(5))-methyltransferase RsmB [Proteobacteria bacterium]|jgi:16S rRNA (cytosine967-C5)-methyltransferase|nr:16S rRNA (cytosine(967)-C(5))-methyltransferase RsmB [Pseudomonadota bacterium]